MCDIWEKWVLLHGGDHVLLAIEDGRGALEARALLAGDLADGALWREVAVEDGNVARRLDGLLERSDHVLACSQIGELCEVLRHRLACDREAVAMEVPLLEHVLEEPGGAPNRVEVLHHVLAGRLQVGDEGRRRGDPLEVVECEVDTCGAKKVEETPLFETKGGGDATF